MTFFKGYMSVYSLIVWTLNPFVLSMQLSSHSTQDYQTHLTDKNSMVEMLTQFPFTPHNSQNGR